MMIFAVVLLLEFHHGVAQPVPVGGQKQLFIDNALIENPRDVTLRIRPASKTGEHTLEPDKAWESATLNWFSVVDEDGKFRMWYEAYDVEGWPTGDDTSFCYAESADGVHWTKPNLGLCRYHDAEQTNVLFRMMGPPEAHSRVHGTCVFLDRKAPAAERYKAVSQGLFPALGTPPHFVAGMYSPDGLHWTRYPEPICRVFADSQYSAFWDGGLGQYVLFGRVSGQGRAIGRSASADFAHFEPMKLVLERPEHGSDQCDVYNPAAIKYPYADGVYLMFPSLYRHDTDTLDIGLAVSRDGLRWTRPDPATPFIALGPAGSFDCGSLYMGQGIIRTNNGLSLYYSGSPLKHNEAELPNLTKPGNQRIFSRAVTPLDRFVAVTADAVGGSFATPPLLFQGGLLALNVEIGEGGSVRVGLAGENGESTTDRTLDDCLPIGGDHLAAAVRWKTGCSVSSRAAIPTRLNFSLKNARLYAFRFTASGDETD